VEPIASCEKALSSENKLADQFNKEKNLAQDERTWTKPQAMAIPKEGYFELQQGKYGPVYPKTPACYGFTIIAKIKTGREEVIRGYGKTIEGAIKDSPDMLGPLKLHYLRWVLFDIGKDKYFMYQGIFDTDFDKYTDDAVALFTKYDVQFSKIWRGSRRTGRRTCRPSSSSFVSISVLVDRPSDTYSMVGTSIRCGR
jgi:hypothetical protein